MKQELYYKIAVFAAFVFLFLMMAISACGQVIGVNGAGFFENRTEQSDEWLSEAVGDTWVLRVPGGAIAKFADPTINAGWGLTYSGIDSIQPKYGSDDEEATADALTKWKKKADAQPEYSYLDELVEFTSEFTGCRVIWVANPYIPAYKSMYAVSYLLSNSVPVVAVEMGNESYSQVDFDFQAYKERVEPLRAAVIELGLPVSHPVPAIGVRNSRKHDTWIKSLQTEYPGDWFTFHPYYDGREFPGLHRPVDTAAAMQQIDEWDFVAQFRAMKDLFPEAGGYMVTETNIQPADLVGDTELNAFFFKKQLAAANEFDYFCIHSGVSPDKYGIIYGTASQKRNKTYYSFKDAMPVAAGCDTIVVAAVFDTVQKEIIIQPSDPRCNKFLFGLFNKKRCRPVSAWVTEVVLVSPADTIVDCCEPVPGSSPGNRECKTGSNDDYLHPERFVNEQGLPVCDEPGVVFDHRINTKFNDRIIPEIYNATGVWIDTKEIDFYITLLETGETVVFEDVFRWCENGVPTFFNTNVHVFNTWPEFLTGKTVWTFGVQMIDRETGINIASYWKDHVDMTLYFTGLW